MPTPTEWCDVARDPLVLAHHARSALQLRPRRGPLSLDRLIEILGRDDEPREQTLDGGGLEPVRRERELVGFRLNLAPHLLDQGVDLLVHAPESTPCTIVADPDFTLYHGDRLDLQERRVRRVVVLVDGHHLHDAPPLSSAEVDLLAGVDVVGVRGLAELAAVSVEEPVPERHLRPPCSAPSATAPPPRRPPDHPVGALAPAEPHIAAQPEPEPADHTLERTS